MPENHPPLAVVGLSYRAPGVGRKDLFQFLAEAKSAWSKVPRDRFDQDAFHDPKPEKAGCMSSKGAHFLPDDIYSFDAAFFNLKVEEARAMDPQHRMMLECAFEATESAGFNLHEVAGLDYGVFSAIGSTDFIQQIADDVPSTTAWASAGIAPCMFANRLSYFFNLTGPSIALDAACASSAYALHLACTSLIAGDCSAAFVGASALFLNANQWTFLENMGYASWSPPSIEANFVRHQSAIARRKVIFIRCQGIRVWARRGRRMFDCQTPRRRDQERGSNPRCH